MDKIDEIALNIRMLSVIIPAREEQQNVFFWQSLRMFEEFQNNILEVLVVLDNNDSKMESQLKKFKKIKVLYLKDSNRAQRINLGIEKAKGELILINHPRSILNPPAIQNLLDNANSYIWGGFTHRFDSKHPLLEFTSFYSNFIRGKRGVLYLDHCIFWNRNKTNWDLKLPEVDIFEDTLLSKELIKFAKPQILPYLSTTSAIRFQQNGVWKQALKNQFLKLAYYFDIPHEKMNAWYEKGLGLNQTYKK